MSSDKAPLIINGREEAKLFETYVAANPGNPESAVSAYITHGNAVELMRDMAALDVCCGEVHECDTPAPQPLAMAQSSDRPR